MIVHDEGRFGRDGTVVLAEEPAGATLSPIVARRAGASHIRYTDDLGITITRAPVNEVVDDVLGVPQAIADVAIGPSPGFTVDEVDAGAFVLIHRFKDILWIDPIVCQDMVTSHVVYGHHRTRLARAKRDGQGSINDSKLRWIVFRFELVVYVGAQTVGEVRVRLSGTGILLGQIRVVHLLRDIPPAIPGEVFRLEYRVLALHARASYIVALVIDDRDAAPWTRVVDEHARRPDEEGVVARDGEGVDDRPARVLEHPGDRDALAPAVRNRSPGSNRAASTHPAPCKPRPPSTQKAWFGVARSTLPSERSTATSGSAGSTTTRSSRSARTTPAFGSSASTASPARSVSMATLPRGVVTSVPAGKQGVQPGAFAKPRTS